MGFSETKSVGASGLLHPEGMMRRMTMVKSNFFDIDLRPQIKHQTALASAASEKVMGCFSAHIPGSLQRMFRRRYSLPFKV